MEQDNCLICKITVSTPQKVDIQLSTTEQGHVNVEEFIKESILHLQANTILPSGFLCQVCYADINQFEDYIIKSKQIQHTLLQKYFSTSVKVEGETIENDSVVNSSLEAGEEELEEEEVAVEKKPEQILARTKRKYVKKNAKRKADFDETEELLPRKTRSRKHLKEDIQLNETEETEDKDVDKVDKQTAENSQKYCCEICGKVTNKGNAAKHMNIHTKKKVFNCEFCHKNFTQKVDLRRHINIHMGIFPYVCEFCGKKFAQHTSYNIHKKNHLGKRDHQCIVCGKGLLSKSHLVRHMKTHTSEKNFGCEICGKTFAENYNMLSHMKKVHMKEGTKIENVNQTQDIIPMSDQ